MTGKTCFFPCQKKKTLFLVYFHVQKKERKEWTWYGLAHVEVTLLPSTTMVPCLALALLCFLSGKEGGKHAMPCLLTFLLATTLLVSASQINTAFTKLRPLLSLFRSTNSAMLSQSSGHVCRVCWSQKSLSKIMDMPSAFFNPPHKKRVAVVAEHRFSVNPVTSVIIR